MEISLKDLIIGFEQAYERTKVAKNELDYRSIFCSLFETLNWVVAIDFRLERDRRKKWYSHYGSSGNVVRALRFARNCVHHKWADILYNSKGATFPVEFPVVFHEWQWKGLQNISIPQGRFSDTHGEILYQTLLEHKPVRLSLDTIAGIVTTI